MILSIKTVKIRREEYDLAEIRVAIAGVRQLVSISAYAFKHPPVQVEDYIARRWIEEYIQGNRSDEKTRFPIFYACNLG